MAEAEKALAQNRKATHEYFIDEVFEAGIALTGTEIKSVRAGKMSLQESYARVDGGEAWLINSYIAPYERGSHFNHEPKRPRKLLLHRDQIRELRRKAEEKGYTLIPLRVYLSHGRAKVAIAVARGKKLWDKREAMAKREAMRDVERAFAGRE